jgi:Zn-dependent protease
MTQMSIAQQIAISVLPVLFAITLHEVAHGWVASRCGDQTARLSGRLTLNPLKHIDPVGTIIVPAFMFYFSGFIFGWAKPVPVDARNMSNPRWDMLAVSIAGPLSNLLMALLWAGIAKLALVVVNNSLWWGQPFFFMGEVGITINVVFAVLNFLPIPPLDGGRILANLLPPRMTLPLLRLEPYMFLVLVLLIFTGVLSKIILPPIILLTQGITALFALPPVFS